MKNSSVNGAVEQSALDIGLVVIYGAQVPAGSLIGAISRDGWGGWRIRD